MASGTSDGLPGNTDRSLENYPLLRSRVRAVSSEWHHLPSQIPRPISRSIGVARFCPTSNTLRGNGTSAQSGGVDIRTKPITQPYCQFERAAHATGQDA